MEYARENNLTADPVELERILTEIRGRYDSDEAFAEARAGETLVAMRASLARDLIAKRFEKEVIEKEVEPTEEEIAEMPPEEIKVNMQTDLQGELSWLPGD